MSYKDAAATLVVATLVVYLVLMTPERMSHIAWSQRICRAYVVEGEKGFRVLRYDHDKTDGMRIAHMLSHKALPRRVLLHRPPDQCDVWAKVRAPQRGNGSPFLRLIAHIMRDGAIMRNGKHVEAAILVGTRDKLPEAVRYSESGSFVRTAIVHATGAQDTQDIIDACLASVNATRISDRLCDTYFERMATLRCHYVFNKWMLDRIERPDGRVLCLYRGGTQVSLNYLLSIQMPMEIKCVRDAKDRDVWILMATPLWLTFRA